MSRPHPPIWRTRCVCCCACCYKTFECWSRRAGHRDYCGKVHKTREEAEKHARALTNGKAEPVAPW